MTQHVHQHTIKSRDLTQPIASGWSFGIKYPQTGEGPDSANCWHYPTISSNGLLRTDSANFWHYPGAPHTLPWQFDEPWSHHDRIRYPSFCRTFRLFWHSQTTNDDYLGVEINEFIKNSIDSRAASAGWSCFGHTQNVLLCTPNVWTKFLLHTHTGGTNILLCTPNVWTNVLLCTTNVCTKVLLHTHRECVAPKFGQIMHRLEEP